MLLLDIGISLYLLVALMGMWRTIREWREEHRASLPGALVGCALCLLWLPMLVVMAVWPVRERPARPRRRLHAYHAGDV